MPILLLGIITNWYLFWHSPAVVTGKLSSIIPRLTLPGVSSSYGLVLPSSTINTSPLLAQPDLSSTLRLDNHPNGESNISCPGPTCPLTSTLRPQRLCWRCLLREDHVSKGVNLSDVRICAVLSSSLDEHFLQLILAINSMYALLPIQHQHQHTEIPALMLVQKVQLVHTREKSCTSLCVNAMT